MNKCPRCENENLKEDYNYCPICGSFVDLDMAKEAAKILNTIIDEYKTYECEDTEEEKYRALVVGALAIGINELERTAQEVPVQEQYETREVLNEKLNINVEVKYIDLNELKEVVDKIKDILKEECNCTCTLNVKINY